MAQRWASAATKVLFLFAVATGLTGHDLYLLPAAFRVAKGDLLRVAFHNGDAFPLSEVAPHIARLRDAKISGKIGSATLQHLVESGKETFGEVIIPVSGSLFISVETVPNFIELAPAEFLDYLKEEGLIHVIESRRANGESSKPGRERYTKYAKSLVVSDAADDYYGHALGFAIEIVPLAAPKAGTALPVRVLFHGKPAAGLQMESAWASGTLRKTTPVGLTDGDGLISVAIDKAGLWRLHSLKMERCADKKLADWESSWASLTFAVN